jgi:hypothetical protein
MKRPLSEHEDEIMETVPFPCRSRKLPCSRLPQSVRASFEICKCFYLTITANTLDRSCTVVILQGDEKRHAGTGADVVFKVLCSTSRVGSVIGKVGPLKTSWRATLAAVLAALYESR